MKIDGFLIGMLCVVALALAWPTPGIRGGMLHLDLVVPCGIALVFFLQGSMLSPAAMRAGAAKWPVHLLIQLTTFAVFPIVGRIIYGLTGPFVADDLRLGFFFLTAMASTITSSVAMTAMARGDVPSAVFNASISGLIGMILTPVLMRWVTAPGTTSLPLLEAVGGILKALAIPFALGQICRPLTRRFLGHRKALVNRIDRSVILLIVYSSFCESTATGVWARFGVGQLAIVALLATILLVVMLAFTAGCARLLGFSREEEITAVFCGSKKSLAAGAPAAKVIFAGHADLGMIMLPLLLYHQIQLIVCTLLASRYAARADELLGDKMAIGEAPVAVTTR